MRLAEFDYAGAVALAVVLLAFSFMLLAAINLPRTMVEPF